MNYQCKYCGAKADSTNTLTAGTCQRHPNGPYKGKHALYQGAEKPKYECQHCGASAPSISSLTAATCQRHPLGAYKGKHEPAL
jgi:DNA-directed RNA polymerase subunit RPC12/RpoP